MGEADNQPKKERKPRDTRKVELSAHLVEQAAHFSLRKRHLAALLGIDEWTLHKRFSEQPELIEAYERGKAMAEIEPIRHLYAAMRDGNVKAAIFLAQAVTGLSEKKTVHHEGEVQQRYVVELPAEATLQQWKGAFGPPDDPNVIEAQPAKPVN